MGLNNVPRHQPHNLAQPAVILAPKRLRRPSQALPSVAPPPLPQIYSTVRPTIGFDLNLGHRLRALERRAALEPAHLLVRVQGTIVLSRVPLADEVRREMEKILAPTEILFLTWRERFGRVEVVRRRGAKGWRVEMAQGSPTGIPLIRERVEFWLLRRDGEGKGRAVGGKGETVGSTMVWSGTDGEVVGEGGVFVRAVSCGQVLAELEVLDEEVEEPEGEGGEREGEERRLEVARRVRRRPRVASGRRTEPPRAPQLHQALGRAR